MTQKKFSRGILVTGGAGFIGSHSVDLLLKHQIPVIVLDNLSSGKKEHLNLNHPQLQLIEGDILNYDLVLSLVSQVDAVLHLAAKASVPQSLEDPLGTHATNIQGFLNLLESIKKTNSNIRLVFASSSAVYGNTNQLPCSDEILFSNHLLSPYALQKMQTEQYADLFTRIFGLNCLGLRYFNVYGPRQNPDSVYSGVISRFLKAFAESKSLIVYGDGEQSRDFIHVSEVAMANFLALQNNVLGVCNIATGQPETLNQLIAHIEAIYKKPASVNYTSPRLGDIRHSYADVRNSKNKLQFEAKIDLKEGLKMFMEFTDESY